MRKYNVSFTIEGDMLDDNIKLNKATLTKIILKELSIDGNSYYGNRDIDTCISNLKIEKG